MGRLYWLASVLRSAGLPVREVGGWEQRGYNDFGDVRGVLLHHTAGSVSGNYPSESVVVNGRSGLSGPLANLGLARDGTWIVVAAGRANHAGTGYVSWCGRDNGNQHLIGIEAESTGRGDWTQAQLDNYPRGVAALLGAARLGSSRAIGHKEWAPTRKIDPYGWPGDMHGFRTKVEEWLRGGGVMAISDEDAKKIAAAQLDMTLSRKYINPELPDTTLSRVTTDNSELFLRQREDRVVLNEIKALVQELHGKADVIDTRGQEIQATLELIREL